MGLIYCKVCGGEFHEEILEYENMPQAAQHFPDATTIIHETGKLLTIAACKLCGLVQSVSPQVEYFRDVIRATGLSEEMADFRLKQYKQLDENYGFASRRLIEVGCGQGEFLSLMTQAGWNVFGLEHLKESVDLAKAQGLRVQQGFLDSDDHQLSEGPFDAFASFNFMEHIPDLNTWLSSINMNLCRDSIGLVEVPNYDMMIQERLSTEFIADHVFYFTENTLRRTLEMNGFDVISVETIWHTYILSAVVRKRLPISFKVFKESKKELRENFQKILKIYRGMKIAIWGAGHQALATIALAEVANSVEYVIDSAPFKQGKFTPATHIPIVSPDHLNSEPVDVIFIIAAAYTEEITRTIRSDHGDKFKLFAVAADGIHEV